MELTQESKSRSQEVSEKHRKLIIMCLVFVFSGTVLDAIDVCFNIKEDDWQRLFNLSKDLQIFGAFLGWHLYTNYDSIHIKTLTFLLCLWRIVVTGFNWTNFDTDVNIVFLLGMSLIYYTWVYRLGHIEKINSNEPDDNEAYYIFLPINSVKGLLQAVFLPWQPARYETRMIVDGAFVYSVHRKRFSKKPKEQVFDKPDFDRIGAIKIPLGSELGFHERTKLDRLVGKRAITGLRDCRKLLVVGGYR